MKIITSDDFNKSFHKLPAHIKRLYNTQKDQFLNNWRDPRLHIKKVKSLGFALSFRITRNYRVFFYFQDSNAAVFFDIGHRKDIYK